MGLAISRQLLNMMGGSIRVESVWGKGSVFYLEIPVKSANESVVESGNIHKKELLRLKEGSPPVRILIADDIADNRTLLRTMLESAGFEVFEAIDGIEALKAVQEWKPQAVLLDLRMPRMDGFETMRKLISDSATANLPVIAVTASAFDEDKKIVAQAGFCGYVRKPFQPQDIFEILQEKLDLDFELSQSSSHAKNGPVKISPQDMRTLDEPTKSEMRTALERGDMTRFKALLNKIAPTFPELAEAMSKMAGRYEYDRLTELLGEREPKKEKAE